MRKLGYLIISLYISFCGIVFAVPPGRIVSLAPSITEILYDLGLGDQIIAVTTFCDYPPQALDKPKIGGYSNPSIESIVAMKPDVVVTVDDGNPTEIQDKLSKLGIKTYIFKAKRLKELPQGIRDLGTALDIRDRALKRAARVEGVIHKYEQQLQKHQSSYFGKKAIFIIQPEPLIVAGPNTIIDDAFRLLGLQNIASHAASPYPKYSIEDVVRQSPDIIFIGQGLMTKDVSKGLLRRLGNLEAVKKGHVYYASESLYRLTPQVITGIEEIAGYLGRY